MSNEQVWNDESRGDLRQTLRSAVLGELRLAKRNHHSILETCREVYLQDECPEREWAKFIQFATDELNRAATRLAAEKTTWPEETDSDRLDRVEAALRNQGILLWQASPCCDTCTRSELSDRIDVINRRYPGFRDRIRGYAFFIDQNMPQMLADSTTLSIYLAYGWVSPDDAAEFGADDYAKRALGIGHQVCNCLRDEGFEADWSGACDRKIGVSVNWRRRTMLE